MPSRNNATPPAAAVPPSRIRSAGRIQPCYGRNRQVRRYWQFSTARRSRLHNVRLLGLNSVDTVPRTLSSVTLPRHPSGDHPPIPNADRKGAD